MDYNGLLTRLIESGRRQRSGRLADLVRSAGSDARPESGRRQRSGRLADLVRSAGSNTRFEAERRQRFGL